MKPYKFRLATVQRLREAHRDTQRMRLVEAQQAADLLNEQRRMVAQEIEGQQTFQRELVGRPRLDVGLLSEAQRYELLLRSQQTSLAEQANTIATEVERRRLALAEAERDVKTLEKLDQRQREQHRYIVQRANTKLMDELAMQRPRGK
jgi:flagellar protein FliJ